MPSILITGAGGYVGQELAAELLRTSSSDTTVIIADVQEPPVPASASEHASRLKTVAADLTSPKVVDELINPSTPYESVFLLHGIMSSGSEANFDLGIKVNLDSNRYILDRLKDTMPGVKVIFTSSLAVYGPTKAGFVISENNLPPVPLSSYGSQKLMIEILLNDYSRRGFLDGRAVRLPTVTVRAGKPTQAVWICSPYTIIKNILHARDVPKEAFGDSRSVNLPGLLVTVQEMLDALEQIGGPEKRALVEEKYDADVDRIVQSWSPLFDNARARQLGFVDDISMIENIKRFASSLYA